MVHLKLIELQDELLCMVVNKYYTLSIIMNIVMLVRYSNFASNLQIIGKRCNVGIKSYAKSMCDLREEQ